MFVKPVNYTFRNLRTGDTVQTQSLITADAGRISTVCDVTSAPNGATVHGLINTINCGQWDNAMRLAPMFGIEISRDRIPCPAPGVYFYGSHLENTPRSQTAPVSWCPVCLGSGMVDA